MTSSCPVSRFFLSCSASVSQGRGVSAEGGTESAGMRCLVRESCPTGNPGHGVQVRRMARGGGPSVPSWLHGWHNLGLDSRTSEGGHSGSSHALGVMVPPDGRRRGYGSTLYSCLFLPYVSLWCALAFGETPRLWRARLAGHEQEALTRHSRDSDSRKAVPSVSRAVPLGQEPVPGTAPLLSRCWASQTDGCVLPWLLCVLSQVVVKVVHITVQRGDPSPTGLVGAVTLNTMLAPGMGLTSCGLCSRPTGPSWPAVRVWPWPGCSAETGMLGRGRGGATPSAEKPESCGLSSRPPGRWRLGLSTPEVWPWAHHFLSLCLSFPICKVEMIGTGPPPLDFGRRD